LKKIKKNLQPFSTELRAQFWGAKGRPKIALSHLKKFKISLFFQVFINFFKVFFNFFEFVLIFFKFFLIFLRSLELPQVQGRCYNQ
tara:strand:+ start:2556 stop:2813 length:258 start_codon:yes stop_codon:yes gene_type:complete